MKPAIKAALLSGLVLPGLGQIYLKRYLRGIVLMLLVLAGLGFIIVAATISALDNLQKMQSQGPVDMAAVSKLAVSSPAGASSSCYNVILLLVACCWLFSIIDAYRMGRRMDRGKTS